ncbi:hypothetical protein ACFFW8_15755 [Erwinia tracheiphila]
MVGKYTTGSDNHYFLPVSGAHCRKPADYLAADKRFVPLSER